MSLTILLILCAPALAQSAPAASQYGVAQYGVRTCPNGFEDNELGQTNAASAGDGACASAENAGQGTDAVNEALSETESSADASADASASADSSAPAESDVSGNSASAGSRSEADDKALASITELPETGGAPPAMLGLGASLIMLGLAARKVAG